MNSKKTLIMLPLLSLLLTGCNTLNRDFSVSRMNRDYSASLQEQREQQFRSQINTALQAAAGRLSMTLYDNLGKGGEVYNTFKTTNIRYNYQEGTATVDIQVFWNRRRNTEVVIDGYLEYHNDGNTAFFCTGAEGTRGSDKSYIRKLTKGLYI